MKFRKQHPYALAIYFPYSQQTNQQRATVRALSRAWFTVVFAWLKQHSHRFNAPIKKLRWRSHSGRKGKRSQLRIELRGISRNISILMTDNYQCCVWAIDREKGLRDILYDADIAPVLLPNGQWGDALTDSWYPQSNQNGQLVVANSLEQLVISGMLSTPK